MQCNVEDGTRLLFMYIYDLLFRVTATRLFRIARCIGSAS